MSDSVFYKGERLGKIKMADDGWRTHKFVYIAEDLDSLATLFSLKPDDRIEMEGSGELSYQEFVERYLKGMTAFFPTDEAWFLKDERAKTVAELDKQQYPAR